MEKWIKSEPKPIFRVSNIWRGMLHYFPILGKWIAWKVGNGLSLRVREDPWIGGHSSFKLSPSLVRALRDKGISVMAHVGSQGLNSTGGKRWLQVENLGLEGELTYE